MTAVQKAQLALDAAQLKFNSAKHNFLVRAAQTKKARAVWLASPTKVNLAEYRRLMKIRRRRLTTWRVARVNRDAARARLKAAKVAAKRPMRRKALDAAMKDVGVTERGGNNRGKDVERIIKKGGGSPGDAWCLWAVIAWYRRAGSKLNWADTYGAVRLIPTVCKRVALVLAGHILQYTFEHTGLFICWCDKYGNPKPRALATHLKAVEGNTGDAGAVSDSQTGGDGVKVKIRPKEYLKNAYRATK